MGWHVRAGTSGHEADGGGVVTEYTEMLHLTAIYRAYDCDGSLLYIGQSKTLGSRLRRHETSSTWFTEFLDGGRIECELVWGDKKSVDEYEKQLIQNERPEHNWIHNNRKRSRRKRQVAS